MGKRYLIELHRVKENNSLLAAGAFVCFTWLCMGPLGLVESNYFIIERTNTKLSFELLHLLEFCQSVSLSVCQSVSLSVCQSVSPSIPCV